MSLQSDKRSTGEQIAYLERAISGLRYTVSSAESRAAECDREIENVVARKARILSDAEKAPTMLEAMETQLRILRSIDFLSSSSIREKFPKGSGPDLQRQLFKLREKMATLGITPEMLEAFNRANPS